MNGDEVLNLKVDDVFIFPDNYVNSEMKCMRHNYKCHILSVIIDEEALQGFTIKRYLKTKRMWQYEFFDVFKVMNRCHLIRKT